MSEPGANDRFVVEGILVAGHPGQVRIVMDQVALDFDEDDVLDATPIEPPPLLMEGPARAVRLELRCPTRLLGLSDASPYDDVIWKRGHLFSLRTRRDPPTKVGISDDYRAREQAFYARYGMARSKETP